MARIFVSYSRKNKEFCKRLADELEKRDLDLWVDWDDIPPTVDWKLEIQKGIEEADTFLAIVSADWISSQICKDELDVAVKNGKRLIPVVPYDIIWDDVPPSLAQLNFIFFTENFDFNAQLEKLFTALDTDYDWLKTHRRLQVKALEWERSNRDNGFLLRGKDLEEAEGQISINANKDPHPIDLQREYVLKSRQATDRQRRITTAVMSFIILMLVGISAYLITPRVLEAFAKGRAMGEMVTILEGPAVFGTENPMLIEAGFAPLQTIPSLPAFQIGKYEVTNAQYKECVTYGNCTVPVEQEYFQSDTKKDHPVVNVTLYQASNYCQWLGQRLPSQAEWERAVRGPDGENWTWGNDDPTPERANMPWGDFMPKRLFPVNSHQAGARLEKDDEIYNLIGNVWEWTSSYAKKVKIFVPTLYWNGDPEKYNGTLDYIQVGGGWKTNTEEVALYNPGSGTDARAELGFRCAADVR